MNVKAVVPAFPSALTYSAMVILGSSSDTVVTPRAAAAYLVHSLVAEAGGSIQVSDPEEGVLMFGATMTAG